MIKQYFKQAWQLLKENKLYSAIYILGTAIAIAMAMVIAVFIFLKQGNIYPEADRNRMLYVGSIEITPKDTSIHNMSASNMSYQTVKNVFYTLQSVEAVTAVHHVFNEEDMITMPDNKTKIPVLAKFTDSRFWKVFQFKFIDGKPYSEEEFSSGVFTAVIGESLAKQLFGNENATGRYVNYNDKEYRISGVVKDVSIILNDTYANIWIPFTTEPGHLNTFAAEGILGSFSAFILAKSSRDLPKVKQEIQENIKKYEANLTWKINLLEQPDNAFTRAFRRGNMPLNMKKIKLTLAVLLLIFFTVPAINLSGLNSSRMEKRSGELGIRKAFGASRFTILNQVLVENLLLSFLGGIIGLLVSYLIVMLSKQWLIPMMTFYQMSNPTAQINNSVGITTQMLFNIEVFFWAFVAVLVINTLSAIVPAYRFSRKSVINSLYDHP